jgi:hypothetical protein
MRIKYPKSKRSCDWIWAVVNYSNLVFHKYYCRYLLLQNSETENIVEIPFLWRLSHCIGDHQWWSTPIGWFNILLDQGTSVLVCSSTSCKCVVTHFPLLI